MHRSNPIDTIVIDATCMENIHRKFRRVRLKTVEETGEIVLSRVVIPECCGIGGAPGDFTAANYYVRYRNLY